MTQGPDFSSQPRRRRSGPVERALVLAAGVAALASAISAFGSWSDMRRAQAALDRTREELTSVRARAQSLEPRAGAADETLASRILLSREAPPQAVMGELSALLPADVRLDDVRLSYDERLTLELRVRARDTASYDRFLERLAASPRFAGIVPGEESRGPELTALLRLWYRAGGRS
jgi:hypothetical protein